MNIFTTIPVDFINNVTPTQANIIIFCATYLGVIMAICCVVYLALRKFEYQYAFSNFEHVVKKTGDIFVLFVASFGAYFFSVVLKNAYHIGRPAAYTLDLHPLMDLTGYGFPSSHAAFYSAIAVTMFFMNKTAGTIAIIIAFIIGVSRVLAGVHSPLDVMGGFILGVLISCLVDFVVEKLNAWKVSA